MSLYGFTVQDLINEGRVKKEFIEIIREWVKMEKLANWPDETLALFLIACDNNIENTKKCSLAYYKLRRDAPELFADRDITRHDIQHQLKVLNFSVLPERTKEGYAIIFHRLVDFEASQYHMEIAMKVYFMTAESSVYYNPPTGFITLFDMRGVGLRHIGRIKISAVKKFLNFVQEALPAKLVAIHVLNVVWFFDKIMKLIKAFIKPEILECLYLHPSDIDMEEFYNKCIPRKCLPKDYGGELASVDELHKLNIEILTNLQEYFRKEEAITTA